jgi:hypothetical protein
MASEVGICNLALSHLGDTATVASIKPPDASVQAQLCARFYPIARDALLEMGSWGFATRRVQLTRLNLPTFTDAAGNATPGTWLYAYALPNAVINVISVLSATAADDYEEAFGAGMATPPYPQGSLPVPGAPAIMPQSFALETQEDGTQIVLTNVPDAVLRYTTLVQDTTKFSPLFTLALSWLLASMLAGPILKGDQGEAAGERCLTMFKSFEGMAESSDANQRKTNVKPAVCWIRGR